MTEEGFSQAIEAIYAAAVDQDQWTEAMDLIAQEVGGRGTLLGINAGRVPQFFSVTGYEQAAIDSFTDEYAAKSYVWGLLPGAVSGDLIHDRHVMSADRRRRDAFANEWATPNDTADCVVLPLIKRSDLSAVAVVARSVRSGAFDTPELAFLRRLVPHLRRAIEVNSRLGHSAHQVDLALDTVDRFQDALVLVTADGVVTHCNRAAEALLRDKGSGVSIVRSRITCRRTDAAAVLRRLIGAAADVGRNEPSRGGTVSIEREGSPWPLTIYCLPLSRSQRWTLEKQPAVLLLLADTARGFDISPSTLSRLFHLTGAEARLALRLAQGDRLTEVAASLGVARSTVASQLHTIFQKTHTRRQSELVRLLHTLPRLDLSAIGR